MWSITPIGFVRSCFTDKFGIPRQAGIVSESKAVIELTPPYDDPVAVAGLETTSHLWIQFVFHKHSISQWKPKVKPPRLGGNKMIGVFATRAPTRPNPLGLSAVFLDRIDIQHDRRNSRVHLHISGHDLLDGTPVIDIKPYVPYADCLIEAKNSFATAAPEAMPVAFSDLAIEICLNAGKIHNLQLLITQILGQNPRPAYQKHDPNREYGMQLYTWDVKWRYRICESSGCESVFVESLSRL